MQAIYAYMQAEGSDYLLALDQIGEDFAPDLNAMEVQDRKLLEGQKQIATLLFKEWYEKRQFDAEDAEKEIVDAVNRAVVSYQNQSRKDLRYYHDQMLIAVERIYDHYLANRQLLNVLTDLVQEEEEKRSNRFTEAKGPDVKQFLRNQAIEIRP